MQFLASSIEAMRKGHKTMTRRVQRRGGRLYRNPYRSWNPRTGESHSGEMVEIRRQFQADRGVWGWQKDYRWLSVGRRYAIQRGRGKFGIGSFLCTSLRSERLQDISTHDLAAEGFPIAVPLSDGTVALYDSANEFIELWDSLHKKGEQWADNPKVWVIGMGEFQWKEG